MREKDGAKPAATARYDAVRLQMRWRGPPSRRVRLWEGKDDFAGKCSAAISSFVRGNHP